MQQFMDLWAGMDMRRRVVAILSVIAVGVTLATLYRMATKPALALLYSGLESGQAGEVVRSLEQRGVLYDIRGGAIYVDTAARDELRMTLASEGLPRNNSQGYELLDSLSGFGTTSQMFDAAYWRAKEGELARTIATSPQIQAARVHIANAGSNPFQRDLKPTASVSITGSGSLSSGQVRALKFLIASAVAGLRPEDVAIIDSSGELLAGDESATPGGTDDKADRLRDRVQRLLEARVGFGNAVVEVSVDTVTEQESIRERRFDPESRVAISTDTEERTGTAENAANDVTVASNLPDGAGAAGDTSSSQSSETRERVNYEVSETEREILRVPGAVKRLSVAVLVNGVATTQADGEATIAPRDDEELAALKDLVASAVGYDEDRGDIITIKSMIFEEIVPEGTLSSGSWTDGIALDPMTLIQMGILALVAIVLGLFVVRPILSNGGRSPALPSPSAGDLPEPLGEALTGEISDDDFTLPDLPVVSDFNTDGLPGFDDQASSSDPVERLQSLIGERRDETVEILRGWLEDREEPA